MWKAIPIILAMCLTVSSCATYSLPSAAGIPRDEVVLVRDRQGKVATIPPGAGRDLESVLRSAKAVPEREVPSGHEDPDLTLTFGDTGMSTGTGTATYRPPRASVWCVFEGDQAYLGFAKKGKVLVFRATREALLSAIPVLLPPDVRIGVPPAVREGLGDRPKAPGPRAYHVMGMTEDYIILGGLGETRVILESADHGPVEAPEANCWRESVLRFARRAAPPAATAGPAAVVAPTAATDPTASVTITKNLLVAPRVNVVARVYLDGSPVPVERSYLHQVRLYFQARTTGKLAVEERMVVLPELAVAETLLAELIKGPRNPDLLPSVPAETRVLSVKHQRYVTLVDFSLDLRLRTADDPAAEALAVAAIVSTLTQWTGIWEVQFLIGGEKVATLAGHVAIDQPLTKYDVTR
jgi:hypothetical protein